MTETSTFYNKMEHFFYERGKMTNQLSSTNP